MRGCNRRALTKCSDHDAVGKQAPSRPRSPWRTSSGWPTASSTSRAGQQRATLPRARHHVADVRRARRSVDDRPAPSSATPTRTGRTRETCGACTGTTISPGDRVDVPDHVVLPTSLTGVDSPIIVVFGDRFPMITAHKVLAAYACLAPRVVTGQFDPTRHRAIWPSTGNYARGGIAISRIMASRGRRDPARRNESGTLRLARPLVRQPGRGRDQDGRHGEQRQGDLRRLQRAGRGPDQLHAQPVLRVRQPPRPLRGDRACLRPRVRARASGERARSCGWRRSSAPPDPPARSPPATG